MLSKQYALIHESIDLHADDHRVVVLQSTAIIWHTQPDVIFNACPHSLNIDTATPSVCLSVTCWYCVKTAKRLLFVFCVRLSHHSEATYLILKHLVEIFSQPSDRSIILGMTAVKKFSGKLEWYRNIAILTSKSMYLAVSAVFAYIQLHISWIVV